MTTYEDTYETPTSPNDQFDPNKLNFTITQGDPEDFYELISPQTYNSYKAKNKLNSKIYIIEQRDIFSLEYTNSLELYSQFNSEYLLKIHQIFIKNDFYWVVFDEYYSFLIPFYIIVTITVKKFKKN